MARYALAFAALIAIAQAIMITSPGMNGEWDLSEGKQTITWSSVSTDPTTVDIYLVHMAAHPPIMDKLFSNVDIGKGSEDVTGLQLPTGENYQINFVSPNKPEQILAQSQQFTVKGLAESASSTLAGFTGASSTSSSASSTSSTSSSSSSSSTSTTASSSSSDVTSSTSSSATETSSLTSSSGTPSATTGTSTFTSTGSSTTVTGTSTFTSTDSSATGTGSMTTSASSGTRTSSITSATGNGAAATGIPMMGLLAGAAALFL